MEVTPFLAYLDSLGKKSSALFVVKNDKDTAIAVETNVLKVDLDNNNIEISEPNEEDFFIMPPQSLLQAGESQTFRVRYIGSSTTGKTQAYRINFNQLSLENNIDTKEATVKMLFNFSSLVFVSPQNSKPVAISNIKNTDNGVNISIKNEGNKVLDLSQYNVSLIGSKSKKPLSWLEVSYFSGIQFILPNRERSFFISKDKIPNELGTLVSIAINE